MRSVQAESLCSTCRICPAVELQANLRRPDWATEGSRDKIICRRLFAGPCRLRLTPNPSLLELAEALVPRKERAAYVEDRSNYIADKAD